MTTFNKALAGIALIAGLAIAPTASVAAANTIAGTAALLTAAPAVKLQTLETTGSKASLILVGRGGAGFGRGFGGGRNFGHGGHRFGPHRQQTKRSYGYVGPAGAFLGRTLDAGRCEKLFYMCRRGIRSACSAYDRNCR